MDAFETVHCHTFCDVAEICPTRQVSKLPCLSLGTVYFFFFVNKLPRHWSWANLDKISYSRDSQPEFRSHEGRAREREGYSGNEGTNLEAVFKVRQDA